MKSTIKPKIGKCLDCGHSHYLTAGRCRSCYWQHRSKVNAKKPTAVARQERKQDLTSWFYMQLNMAPTCCENPACGALLRESMVINPRTIVAHVISKSLFPEVATHPLNRVFLCQSCHYNYDNGAAETMQQLLIICRTRYGAFKDKILPVNLAHIPDYLI